MSETFFGSGATEIAEAEPAQEMATVAEAQVEQPAAEPAETEVEAPDAEDEDAAPSFALVRVEPDGSAVIAGTASPNAEVQIYVGDEHVGTETTEATGDFAYVTEEPLPPGGVEVRVLDVETDTFAPESVVVVVQDDKTSEPIVIASQSGEASRILQGIEQQAQAPAAVEPAEPEAPAMAEVPVAQEEPALVAQADEQASEQPSPAVTPAAPQPETTVAVEPADEPQPVTADADTASTDESAQPQAALAASLDQSSTPDEPAEASEPEAAPESQTTEAEPSEPQAATPNTAAPAASTQAGADDRQAEVEPEPQAAAPQPPSPGQQAQVAEDIPAPAPASDAEQTSPQAEPQPAPAEAVEEPIAEEPVPAQPVVVAAQPTIDAVEIDGDLNFFAGAGSDGMSVRLYVDNELIGTSEVSDGRWLVEANGALGRATQRVRVDMLDRNGNVVGRAEVDFVLDLPETVVAEQAPPAAPAEAPASQEPASEEPAEEEVAAQPLAPAQPSPAASQPPADVPALPTRVEADQGEQEPAPTLPETAPQAVPQAPDEPAQASDDDVPTLVGVTEGTRTTSGLAIIRSGDNLWTIARRVYGEGMRYTQIFEANTDQIRDPDLIYPGQVFDLPDTDQVVGEEEGGAVAVQ